MDRYCPNCGANNNAQASECSLCEMELPRVPETTRPELGALGGRLAMMHGLNDEHNAARVSGPQPTLAGEAAMLRRVRESGMRRAVEQGAKPIEFDQVPVGARLSIGFDEGNDLVIPRHNVSGHHAILIFDGQDFYLQDLESPYGTTINAHPIHNARLHEGDIVGLGSYVFVFDDQLAQRLREREEKMRQRTQAMQAIEAREGGPLTITIGRDADCDIIFDAPQISRKHVCFTKTAYGWTVEDLGSANGTFLHDRHNALLSPMEVTEKDVIYMGSYRFPVSRLHDFKDVLGRRHERERMSFSVGKKVLTLGRGEDNDIVLDEPQVSRHHARIVRAEDGHYIEDLASANGTFLNGDRVGRAKITEADTLSFGTTAVRLDLERGKIQKSYRGDIVLQSEHIRVDVQEKKRVKRLLDGISFTVYPTEFVGLMGPSGAGKTTLLMSMIGYLQPTYGRTLLNGDELATHYDRYRGAIGYVPQEDIIHGELTVYEALYYTAKLRLPQDTSRAEIDRRIHEVLAALEISETRDVVIGSPERKGISGGQRKRVNLALELLTEPSLLCLDEPTSGLASEDALNVMRLLRRLADGGRTILLTVHQPSLQAYRMMDNVLYLADGEQVYYGPSYPDSLTFFYPHVKRDSPEAENLLSDPGSCLRPLVDAKRNGEPMETFAARYRQSAYYEEYVEERRHNLRDEVRLTETISKRQAPRFRLSQLMTLSARYLSIKLKDRIGTTILLIQAPIIAVLINLVFMFQGHDAGHRMEYMPFAIFLLITSAIWFGCSNAAREIVSEQAIYKRERMVNLSIGAYVGSKFVVLSVLALVQCLTLLWITYFTLDFGGNPLQHLLILWLCTLASTGMGLILSSTVRTTAAALALVPLLLIPQVILGGAIMPLEQMQDPSWSLSQTTISRWAFEGMLHVEDRARAYELEPAMLPKPLLPGLPAPPPAPHPLDRFFGSAETSLPLNFLVLGGFTIVFLFGTGGVLRLRERA